MNINEALKTLKESKASQLAKQLDQDISALKKELRDIEDEVYMKARAKKDEPEYKELSDRVHRLYDEKLKLLKTYSRWVAVAEDEYDLDIDPEGEKANAPRMAELENEFRELNKALQELDAKIAAETAVDTSEKEKTLASKKAELAATLAEVKKEAEPEVLQLMNMLKAYSEENCNEYSPFFTTAKRGYTIKDGYLYVTVEGVAKYEVTDEDFNWRGDYPEFEDYRREEIETSLAEDGLLPDGFAEAEGLEKDSEGWYRLPFKGWRLSDEMYVYSEGEPEVVGYYYDKGDYWNPPESSYDSIDNSTLTLISEFLFSKPLSEFEDKLEEAFFKEHYGEKAWMLNQIISNMNDEEAYYSGWLYIWPDGESYEDCLVDFEDPEDYEELEQSFIKHYSDEEAHEAGLYRPQGHPISDEEWQKIVDAAHEWDKKLGLEPIAVVNA